MSGKKVDATIKQLKDFIDLWLKFHDLYQEAMTKEKISPEEEKGFLETKSLIARKYQALLDTLGIDPTPDDKTFDVISSVLSLSGVSSISDMQRSKIENDWHESYISLNKILGSLESRGRTPVRTRRVVKTGGLSFSTAPLARLIIYIIVIIVLYVLATKLGIVKGAVSLIQRMF